MEGQTHVIETGRAHSVIDQTEVNRLLAQCYVNALLKCFIATVITATFSHSHYSFSLVADETRLLKLLWDLQTLPLPLALLGAPPWRTSSTRWASEPRVWLREITHPVAPAEFGTREPTMSSKHIGGDGSASKPLQSRFWWWLCLVELENAESSSFLLL